MNVLYQVENPGLLVLQPQLSWSLLILTTNITTMQDPSPVQTFNEMLQV